MQCLYTVFGLAGKASRVSEWRSLQTSLMSIAACLLGLARPLSEHREHQLHVFSGKVGSQASIMSISCTCFRARSAPKRAS